MDTEQEDLQFLGFLGIIRESFKIIITWKKLFTQITLTLVLPLSFISMTQPQFSKLLLSNLYDYYFRISGSTPYKLLFDRNPNEWIIIILSKVSYLIFLLLFSLLSTSAVVYTVASVYTSKEISFKKVMSVVPKVWKRLIVTFLWNFTISFFLNFIFGVFYVILLLKSFGGLVVLCVVYLAGIVYMTLIWQLASVVSVLEDLYGLRAMIKSMDLIKGKMGVSLSFFLIFVVFSGSIEMYFQSKDLRGKVGIGLVCLVLLVITHLFVLVVQTVIYLVCKSYHHENIDESSLINHLENDLGEHVPLKSKDVQLEHVHV